MDGGFKKRVSDQMNSDSDSSSHSVEVLSATDKMANAITAKLQADMQATAPPTPTPVRCKYALSFSLDNWQVMREAGILNEELLANYVQTLEDWGFETPCLMLGVLESPSILNKSMGFKAGHSIRLLQFLGQIDRDA